MRIASNTISDTMLRQIQQLTGEQAKLQTQISTGRRITQPEEDPAAVGRVLNLQSEQRRLAQYATNASRAMTVVETSYSGLQGLKKVSDRAGELATLGSGALDSTAMQTYASEVDQLLEQALQLGNSTSGNNYLYGGTVTDKPPFVATRDANGKITSITYQGNLEQAAIQLSEASSVTPTTSGVTNTGIGDFLNNLVTLRDKLTSGDAAGVRTVQSALTTSEDMLISSMAEIGGMQSRIEAAQSQQTDRSTSLAKLVSDESAADLPTSIVKLNQTQTAYQAALASASKIMSLSLLDYIK